MATINHVKGWTGVLMTEDSSFHWPTKPQSSSVRGSVTGPCEKSSKIPLTKRLC